MRPGSARHRLELLVVQPTSFCNLDCTYCYVPDRRVKTRLSIGTLERLLNLLKRDASVGRQSALDLLWHAGEPLAVGVAFYEEAGALIRSVFGRSPVVRQHVQTNGTLVDERWCDLFRRHGMSVGLSIDGPRSMHDSRRRARNGTGSFDRAMRAAKLLREHEIPTGALCVLTADSLREPDQLFEFFTSEGFQDVGFNVEEIEGSNVTSSLSVAHGSGTCLGQYRSFFERMLELDAKAGHPLRIRETQSILGHIVRMRAGEVVARTPEQTLGAIVTMTHAGLLSSWSPELVSARGEQLSSLIIGDVNRMDAFDRIFEDGNALRVQSEIDEGIRRCEASCDYFQVCGGGSPSNKYFEHGTFAATETLQCSMQVKALTEGLLSFGGELQQR